MPNIYSNNAATVCIYYAFIYTEPKKKIKKNLLHQLKMNNLQMRDDTERRF